MPFLHRKDVLFLFALAVLVLSGLPHPFTWPSYWDGTLGPMAQAVWLHQNNFDYHALIHDVPGYYWGGPRVYLWSVYPPFLALMMRLTGSPGVFYPVLHLLHYLMAAGCVVVATDLARRLAPRVPAWAPAALLLSHPFFLTQAAAVNMEIPVLLCALLAIRAYWTDRIPASLLWTLAGCAVKASILPVALAAAAAFLVARARGPAGVLRAVALGAPYALMHVLGILENFRVHMPGSDTGAFVWERLFQWQAWVVMGSQALGRTPDLVLAGLGLLVTGLVLAARALRDRSLPGSERRAALELPVWLLAGGGLLVMVTLCLNRILPRYSFSFHPILLCGFLLVAGRVRPAAWRVAAGLWIALNLANLNGAVARACERATAPLRWGGRTPPSESVANNGHILERSFECRGDIALQRELARVLETEFADRVIVTTWPLLHHFRNPWFGYVSKPLNVMASHRPGMQWDGVESFWAFHKAHPDHGGRAPGDYVWVWTNNVFAHPRPQEAGRVPLREVRVGNRSAWIFTYSDWPAEPVHPR